MCFKNTALLTHVGVHCCEGVSCYRHGDGVVAGGDAIPAAEEAVPVGGTYVKADEGDEEGYRSCDAVWCSVSMGDWEIGSLGGEAQPDSGDT
jgi:hypothetical protein